VVIIRLELEGIYMLILVLGNHTSQTRLDVVKALKDAGAHASQESNQYQDMDFRRLNENHLDWKHPEPSPFDQETYDALYLECEDKHDDWVLSDPRMLFYVEDYLSLAKSHRNKSRIIVVHADIDKTAADIAQIHNFTMRKARQIARWKPTYIRLSRCSPLSVVPEEVKSGKRAPAPPQKKTFQPSNLPTFKLAPLPTLKFQPESEVAHPWSLELACFIVILRIEHRFHP
jgi:hypothetical protein